MRILVLTNIYPLKETKKGFTPVVRYFCESWVRLGHEVVLFNSSTKFPFFYYWIPKFLVTRIETSIGFSLPNKFVSRKIIRTENCVKVFQLPIFKYYPGQKLSLRAIREQYSEIDNQISAINFKPDLIVAHWLEP